MKTTRKALLMVLCAVLLVAGSVLGTMAYLTDTEDVTNTFTFGKVDIKLDEATLDKETGKATSDPRTETGNTDVKMIPGRVIDKDPTVTVLGGSEACFVRMKVTVENLANLKAAFPAANYPTYYSGEMFLLDKLCNIDSTNWTFSSISDNVYEFRYKSEVAKSDANTPLPALFTTLTVPGAAVTNENIDELASVQIKVTAEAVQSESFGSDANTAWAAITTTP